MIKKHWLLILILFLAAFLRFYQLDSFPPSLNWDEVSHGYNAYSLLKTGQDEWGKRWPLLFRAYGDYKLPVYIYLTALSEAVLGVNAWAVRLSSALAGVLAVLFTYLLVKKIFKKEKLGLLAALFLSISPWHFFLSRPAFEANLACFLVLGGVYFFLRGLKEKWAMVVSVIFFGLSVYTYNSARVFVPLFLAFLSFIYRADLAKWVKGRKKSLVLTFFLLVIFFLPLFVSLFSQEGQARFGWVTVLDQGTINRINQARGNSTLVSPLPVLIHNKVTYFGLIFTRNFLKNLSPKYLFFQGGSNYQHNPPGQGLIHFVHLPFVLLGLFWIFKNWAKKEARLLLAWWLLALVPSSATRDNPHVLRTILVLPVPQVLAALGLGLTWGWWQNKFKNSFKMVLPFVYGLVLLILTFSFLSHYFGPYAREYSWSWQYGYQPLVSFLKENYGLYDKIMVSKKYGEPHEFILFYWPWDPESYRKDPNLNRYFLTDWYWVDGFDKFVFINDWEVNQKAVCPAGRCLLVTSPGNYPEGWEKLKTINFLDLSPAFEIYKK